MAHPKLQLSRLLDWLTLRIECEDTSPTDEQIVAFLGLDSEQTARSMLADLADRGDITIRGSGAARQIALGRQHRAIETPRPVPSVIRPPKPMLSEEECVRRIQMITGREPVQPDSPAAELEAPASGEGERLEVSDLRAPAPSVPIAAPPSFESLEMPAVPGPHLARHEPATVRIDVALSRSAFNELRRRTCGRSLGVTATEALNEALQIKPSHAPTPLFRIPAEVTRAAIRDGIPVMDFARAMMIGGFFEYARRFNQERAA